VDPISWRAHLPEARPTALDDLTARRSLPAAWRAVWAASPHAPVLWDVARAGQNPCTAGELDHRTIEGAIRLRRLGLRAGDRVVWSVGSSLPAVMANIAALRAGLVVVPVNPAYTERELAHIVGDVRPAAAIVDDPERGRQMAASGSLLVMRSDLELAGVGPERSASVLEGSDDVVLDEPDPGAPALVAYTSGTTGAPKGAVLTHANLLANCEAVAVTWRWGPDDVLVHALPIFHGHGLCVALYTTLLAGASAVLLPRFDVAAVLDALTSHRATLFFGVPTMYHRIAASSRLGELSGLRLAVSGSAALNAELHGRIAAAGTSVLERYGTTETMMITSNPYEGERRPGTVGFPFPGVGIRLGDAADLPDGVEEGGDVLVRGPALFAGYWERPAATADSFEDGWFRTGDLGVVEDGYLRLLGRSTDLIVSGGYNVYPVEVEDVLLGHPSVGEVAVAGTPSDEWGEVVTAWVVPDGSARPDAPALVEYAAARLAPYKLPRVVRFVDALPRNPMGKVQRSELR
jgi:malonyl-CoA/methylmalonyl-CoA synthetase